MASVQDPIQFSESPLAIQKIEFDSGHEAEKIAINRDHTSDESEHETDESSDETEYETDESSHESEYETDESSDDSDSEFDKGFDLPFTTSAWDGPVKPYYSAHYPEFNKKAFEKYKKILLFSINDFNLKPNNRKLELVNLLKVNRNSMHRIYYFTFLAKVVSTGETKTYQSKVYDSYYKFIGPKVLIFREKPSRKAIPNYTRATSLKKQNMDGSIEPKEEMLELDSGSGDDYHPDEDMLELDSGSGDNYHHSTGIVSSDDSDSDPEVRQQLIRYRKHIRESDGFDLPFVPKFIGGLPGAIQPYFHADIPGYECRQGMDDLSYAIQYHNEREVSQLELVKVLKLNIQYCFMLTYYFTFLAKDVNTGEIKKYQTKVYNSPRQEIGSVVMLFREKKLKDGETLFEAGEKSSSYWRYYEDKSNLLARFDYF